jgi:hypothetical protein
MPVLAGTDRPGARQVQENAGDQVQLVHGSHSRPVQDRPRASGSFSPALLALRPADSWGFLSASFAPPVTCWFPAAN